MSGALIGVFVVSWLGLLADGYDLYVYGATIPGILGGHGFDVTTADVGLVGSIALVGMLCGSLVVGILTDRLGRRRIFISFLTLFSLMMLACAIAPNWTSFAAFRFVACFGVGGLLPTAVAVAHEFAPAGRKSIVVGIVLTGPAAGTVIASLTALGLLETHGFRPVYAIAGLALLIVPACWRLLPESPSYLRSRGRVEEAERVAGRFGVPVEENAPVMAATIASSTRALFHGGRTRTTIVLWMVCLLSLLTIFGVSTWLPQIMREAGYGVGSSVSFLLAYSVGAIIGTIIAALLGQRFGPKPMVMTGFVAAAVALGLMATNPSGIAIAVLSAVAGFGGLGTQNMINDYVAQYYPAGSRATGLGWALAVGRIGAIVGPTYGAFIIGLGGGVSVAAISFAVPALFGAALMFAVGQIKSDSGAGVVEPAPTRSAAI
ncbi:MFS transporter [Spelaeicoccus albus]|nr:MFS transporter [Spelaeicoccus albus]